MPIISRSCIEDIRQKVNIYDLVSPVVGLKKVGANYRGLSPFTNEKTPSFYVLPDKNIFKDFSSGEAGDIYKFVQLTERLNFQEAIESIAARFNLPVEYEKGQAPAGFKPSLRKEILDIHDLATEYYQWNFFADNKEGAFIREYWQKERMFSEKEAKDYKIGLALPKDSKFFINLHKKGFSYEALNKCGLFFPARNPESEEPLFPRFRGRLMIPIREHANQRVVAFTARQLEITPDDDRSREAKYVNSPETPLFNKSHLLFGLYKSKKEVSDTHPFILVEGQLDVLRCWSVGLPAVAPQGTSVTENQLLLLKRFNDRIVCLLDGDEAGRKAALRTLPIAWKAGLDIAFHPLPDGADPDDEILKSGTAFAKSALADSIGAIPFAVQSLVEDPLNANPREKNRTANAIFELLTQLESELMRMEYLRELSRLLGIREDILSADFKNYLSKKFRRSQVSTLAESPEKTGDTAISNSKLTNAEEDLILALFEFPSLGSHILQAVDNEWIDDSQVSGRILNRILAETEEGSWNGVSQMEEMLETDEERNYYYNLRSKELHASNLLRSVEEAVLKIYKRFIQKRIHNLDVELANAQSLPLETQTELAKQRSALKHSITDPPVIKIPFNL
ncbi:MAG: DNA primase [Opitutaceae bacterium]|nr:DNA primase [Opitutaceae bacterium]|tara:strand:+ start:5169 stop:7034 length:1866 start_codon:yes stop_codon:yes gene_type:complete